MKDLERFSKNLLGLVEALQAKPLSEFAIMTYVKALQEFSDDDVEQAILKAAMTMKFFPKPVELVDLIHGNPDEQALIAWEELEEAFRRAGPYDSVHFIDSKITRTLESMGGWIQACSWVEDELKFKRQEFLKTYRSFSSGGPQRSLPGMHEANNLATGFVNHIPSPVSVGRRPARPEDRFVNPQIAEAVKQIADRMTISDDGEERLH